MHTRFEHIIESLATHGLYVGETILDNALQTQLGERARMLREAGALAASRIGRATQMLTNTAIRSDSTHWLADAPHDLAEQQALEHVHALRVALNETLFLGANAAELHFAHYAPGAFYATHRDRFADHDARLISLVFYLNEDWTPADGGELVIYDEDQREVKHVVPHAGTMVAFRSEQFPHEVRPARADRFSLTGWLRRN